MPPLDSRSALCSGGNDETGRQGGEAQGGEAKRKSKSPAPLLPPRTRSGAGPSATQTTASHPTTCHPGSAQRYPGTIARTRHHPDRSQLSALTLSPPKDAAAGITSRVSIHL